MQLLHSYHEQARSKLALLFTPLLAKKTVKTNRKRKGKKEQKISNQWDKTKHKKQGLPLPLCSSPLLCEVM